MMRKRATFFTFHTLRTVPKVCRSSENSLNFIKRLIFLRNHSTATERFDFDHSNGINNGYNQNPGNYEQGQIWIGNSSEKWVQEKQNNVGVYGNNYKGSECQKGQIGKNGVSEDNKSVSNFRKGFQPNEYMREGDRGEFQNSPAENKSNFGGGNLVRNSNGIQRSPDNQYGNYEGQKWIGENEQSRGNSGGGYGEKWVQEQKNHVGVYGNNHGIEYQKGQVERNGVFEDNRKGFQQNGDSREGHRGEFQNNPFENKSKFGSGNLENFVMNSNGVRQSLNNQHGNLASKYSEGHGSEFQNIRAENKSNFGSGNLESLARKSNGVRRTPDNQYDNLASKYSEGHRGEFQGRGNTNFGGQRIPDVRKDNFAQTQTGEGQRNEFQQVQSGGSTNLGHGSNENMQLHSSGSVRSSRNWQQSGQNYSFGFNTDGPLNAQPNLNENYGHSAMQSTIGSYGGNSRTPPLQNASVYDMGNVRVTQENSQNHSVGSTGNFQQARYNNYNEVSTGTHQQGYNVGNVRTSEQSSQGFYNEVNGAKHQQVATGVLEQNGETTENDDVELSGTIEELDHFLKEGKLEIVVEVLDLLEKQGIPVDLPWYLSLMKVCGEDKALEEAKSVHKHLVRSIPDLQVSTYNKILEMYSECGSMEDAFNVFDNMQRNLTSWDIMITGLVKNSLAEAAIELFAEFKESGLEPDGLMYIGIFSACSALCDITEGMLHFESMAKDHGIDPSMDHYTSVVGMLGSAGHLDEALEFIEKMPMEPSVEVWETLMNVSRLQGNVELGDRCAEIVELLDPSRLNEQSKAGLVPVKASDLVKEKDKKKSVGQSPLEIRSRVHEYRAGDRSHPDHEKLYALLRGMKYQMHEAGYLPETKFVLHDVDQESKEEALLSHSERLAVAKGLLNTPARTTMRVIKNLRVCGDCHNAMKIISKLVGRELIMRDAKRFHHFKDGICSCRDYW